MRKICIAFCVVGICGIANPSPIPENSTPSTQTASTSTEKVANKAHSTTLEKKGEKELAQTTPSTVTKADKNEVSTSKSKKEDQTKIPSSDKAEIKEPRTQSHKQEGKETNTSSSGKMESNHPSVRGQKDSTHVKPADKNKKKGPNNNKKPKKTSTAYLDKGKVIMFDGICGPGGCRIEGDIYDELVPIPHF